MSKIRTHYDNLKVSRTAPPEVIKAAYKALAQKFHPDRNQENSEEYAKIRAIINQAYATLSDPILRQQHDDWIEAQEDVTNNINTGTKSASQEKEPPHEAPLKKRGALFNLIVHILRNWF